MIFIYFPTKCCLIYTVNRINPVCIEFNNGFHYKCSILSRSCLEIRCLPLLGAGSQNMDLRTKLTAIDAKDEKTHAIEASRRPESDGRRPGPRCGQNPEKGNRAVLGKDYCRASQASGDFQWNGFFSLLGSCPSQHRLRPA